MSDLARGHNRVPYPQRAAPCAAKPGIASESRRTVPSPAPTAHRILKTLACLLLLFTTSLAAQTQTPTVRKLTLHDTIQPISAAYIERGLADAATAHDAAVLLSLGTPGGLLESTRAIVSAIEQSPVPVIVYITPSGSRAGSAGFFILESADVAAMAPGTNVGAAHPIVEGKTLDPILKEKIENDAAAFLRSFVARRGRNVTAAEDAVRNSKSYSDTEALNLHLIDRIAPTDEALLAALDGTTIHRFDGTLVTLHLRNAQLGAVHPVAVHLVNDPPSTRERLLGRLASPDLAVLLLVVGALLIYLEFNVPGTIVPGALGTLLLLLGVFGLNLLPIRHTAILLLVAAVLLLAFEFKFPSHGILALLGIASLTFGLLTLVDGPIAEQRVHPSIAIAAGVGFGLISFWLATIAMKARRNKLRSGPAAMLHQPAVAITALNPSGQVEVRGELWQAILLPPATHAAPGAHLRVQSIEALTLRVTPEPDPN